MSALRCGLAGLAAALLAGCSSPRSAAPADDGALTFPAIGSLGQPSGRGSFRFGVATAATQIEDRNPDVDWEVFTRPVAEGGLGKGKAYVGEASRGYTLALEDVALLRELGVDSYRFSMEWARIEPERDRISEEALAHYSALLDALVEAGIRPVVTLHHFSNPLWIDDPRDPGCLEGPRDENLCGFGHPSGGPLVVEEFRQHAALLATRFGDRVDEWGTLNEPVNYLLASYGVGMFPPGKNKVFALLSEFVPVVRDYLSASAAAYRALKELDTRDADGDGQAADVGLTLSVAEWIPARFNEPSEVPEDVAARDRLVYVFHHLVADSLRAGTFDADLDGTAEEQHPEWRGTLDWLGLQYYFRAGVTGNNGLVPILGLTPCFGDFDFGACLPPLDPTYCVPSMRYEYHPSGLSPVLRSFSERYPDLPLVVSEAGIATEVGERRAENVVRTLQQIDEVRALGGDVRGYYHWSLYDNFEWAEGFEPRFGLYHVDFATYRRSPTLGATVLSEIARGRRVSADLLARHGGGGPLTPEPSPLPGDLCTGR